MTDDAPVALHSVEAERATLGATMYDSRFADAMLEALRDSDFFLSKHRLIFKAIRALRKAGSPIDLVTLNAAIMGKGLIDAIGGSEYLIELAHIVPSPANVGVYAGIVKENAVLRQMERAGVEVAKLVRDHDLSTTEKVEQFRALIGNGEIHLNGHSELSGLKFNPADFEPVVATYLWEPRMPRGKIILWDADGGTQKTTLLAAISAGLSVGQLPNGDGECDPIRTAYFHKGEDDDREIATVFHANGGNFDNVEFFCRPGLNLDRDGLSLLDRIVKHGKFDHVVFDALFYFCQHLKNEGWKDPMAPLPILEGLKDVARSNNITISDLRHTSKGKADKEASEMGFGSVQFRNSHRGQMVMRYHPKPENDDQKGLVIVTDEKGSLLSPRAEAFAFRRRTNTIEYVQDFDNPFDASDTAAGRTNKRRAIGRWLTKLLEPGPMPFSEVEAHAKAAGHNMRTVYRAFGDIRGYAEKTGFGSRASTTWHLSPPEYDPYADE